FGTDVIGHTNLRKNRSIAIAAAQYTRAASRPLQPLFPLLRRFGGCRVQMSQEFFGGAARDYFGDLFERGAFQVGDAAELAQKLPRRARTNAGNFRERRSALALGAALAMERDGKTM